MPVVLIHGTAAWSELWRATIDALAAAGFHVIALDLPPFGFSDRPGDYTRERQAARIDGVLDQLGVAPAIIVGHSFGAGAATRICDAHSEADARAGAGRCGARIDFAAGGCAVVPQAEMDP